MAKIVANNKGRQVLGDLGNVGGMGGKKASLNEITRHESSPKIEAAAAPAERKEKETRAPVVNPRIDTECREYVDDIYDHFLKTESLLLPPTDYMSNQPELTPEMRAVCLDWIIECANRFKMSPETLFLTVNVLDRFLAVKPIQRKRMQLVTMVSLIIASKYEEIYPPRIADFRHISAEAFTIDDMLRYEHSILHALNYTLTVPTSFGFISRYLIELREEGVPESHSDKELRYASHFIAECAMLNLELYLEHVPSLLGAASVHAARTLTEQSPVWPACLAKICTYELEHIEPLSETLIRHAGTIKAGTLQATIKRYGDDKRCRVSTLIN